jgi:hypothetical protein
MSLFVTGAVLYGSERTQPAGFLKRWSSEGDLDVPHDPAIGEQILTSSSRMRPTLLGRYRSSSTATSSSLPQGLTYCAFPIVAGPLGPIS